MAMSVLVFDIGNPKRLIFCESVIDMMSYYQLHQKELYDVRLISMEGLKLSVIAYQTLRLAAEEQGKIGISRYSKTKQT